jgi:hypothetical protein
MIAETSRRMRAPREQPLRKQRPPKAPRAHGGPLDGPGRLSLRGEPRHDNDHESIDMISIMPTQVLQGEGRKRKGDEEKVVDLSSTE